jgi:hypothetical protein
MPNLTQFDRIFPALALKMLAQFGTSAIFTHTEVQTYDTSTLSQPSVSESYNVKVAFPPDPRGVYIVDRFENGSLAASSHRRVLMAALDAPVAPTNGDILTIGGVDYTILTWSPIYSGEKIAAYEMKIDF